MKKVLRFAWLVISFTILLPVIILVEMYWLARTIRIARTHYPSTKASIKAGIQNWLMWLKRGIEMNKDFVINGL